MHLRYWTYCSILLQHLFKVANRWLSQSPRIMVTYDTDTSCWLLQGDRPSPLQWQWHAHGWLNRKPSGPWNIKAKHKHPRFFHTANLEGLHMLFPWQPAFGDTVCHGQYDIRHFWHEHLTVHLFRCNSLKKKVADNSNHRCLTPEVLQHSSVSLGLTITIINNWHNCYSSDLFELSI